MTTTTAYEPLHHRPHTVLGVCEAIGEDFGFKPEWLRLVFGVGVFFAPLWALAAYVVLGLFVLASRKFFPDVRATPAAVEAPMVAEDLPLAA